MALIRNGGNLYPNTYRFLSGLGAYSLLSNKDGGAAKRNWNAGWHTVSAVTNRSSLPDGYRHPGAWMLAQKTGGLSSRSEGNFSIVASNLNLAEGRNIAGSVTFAFDVPNALLQLVVSATGTATITFTQTGLLAGALSAAGNASFSITVANATLGAVIDAVASASFAMAGAATPRAIGWLEGDIIPFTELSPEALAISVWSYVIENGIAAEGIMRILAAVAAGKTNITDLGGGDATVEFRDLADTINRVAADMTGSERTDVTLDPD